eukprot:710946-Hanusia_phi.AAC.1
MSAATDPARPQADRVQLVFENVIQTKRASSPKLSGPVESGTRGGIPAGLPARPGPSLTCQPGRLGPSELQAPRARSVTPEYITVPEIEQALSMIIPRDTACPARPVLSFPAGPTQCSGTEEHVSQACRCSDLL